MRTHRFVIAAVHESGCVQVSDMPRCAYDVRCWGQSGPRPWAHWRVSFRALGQGRISYAILIIADGAAMAIERGWLVMHESGTFVRFTQAGADLFA